MPRLKNPRHEKVARELAAGQNKASALRSAGYLHMTNSSRITKREDVQRRIDELTAQFAKSSGVTKQMLTARLQMCFEDAMRLGQVSAAVAAVKELGQLHGLRIEKQETGPVGSFDALSDKDYANSIMERIQAAMVFAAVKPPGSDTEQ